MPMYEYQCNGCNEVTERVRAIEDRKKRLKCAHCGSMRTELIISRNAFQLIGGGWCSDDYGSKRVKGK